MKTGFSSLKVNEQTGSKERACRLTVKSCLVLVFYTLLTVLFYRQAVEYNGAYFSDLPAHINFSIVGGDYSVLFFVIGIIFRLPLSHILLALFESSIVVLTF